MGELSLTYVCAHNQVDIYTAIRQINNSHVSDVAAGEK